MNLIESLEHAEIFETRISHTYHIRKGTYDLRLWPSPEIFEPSRFLVLDRKVAGGMRADINHLTPFAGGQSA